MQKPFMSGAKVMDIIFDLYLFQPPTAGRWSSI
jgi:hypothetical protein